MVTTRLVFREDYQAFELAGRRLCVGDWLELRVSGLWIPGVVSCGATGWSLVTPDRVEICLQEGVWARFSILPFPSFDSLRDPALKDLPHSSTTEKGK
jgi:hypothetical protein